MNNRHVLRVCSLSLCLLSARALAATSADGDACTLLTAAQVTAAVSSAMSAGTHVTEKFVKTCTWSPSGDSPVRSVTLFLQSTTSYDSGKQLAAQMAAAVKGGSGGVQSASVGDDAYYFVAGDQVGLLVKKGDVAFKVAVYAELPVATKETMEMTLARNVVARL